MSPAVGVPVGVVLAVAVLSGTLLRVWILGNAGMNSDEAVVGLVARQILHGHLTAFVWGQAYGGGEPYLVAAMFVLFGSSPLALNVTPAVLAVVVGVLTWRIGRRVLPEGVAVAAGVLGWVWPESTLFNSTREYGYHEAALVAGMVLLLLSVRIVQAGRPARPVALSGGAGPTGGPPGGGAGGEAHAGGSVVEWAGAGLAAGLGFWASPEVVYFFVPAGVLLAGAVWGAGRGRGARRVLAGAGGAVVGALPWLVASVGDHLATIRAAGAQAGGVSGTYGYRLGVFWSHVLPMLLGLRIEGAGLWEGGPGVGEVLYGVVLVAIGAALVALAWWAPEARPLVAFCVAFPFLYAVFPTSWFWNDGRYGIFLTPVLALVLLGALGLARRWVGGAGVRVAGALVVAGALGSTLVAFQSGFGALGSTSALTRWQANPDPAVSALAGRLSGGGVGDAYAGYWVAYDLEFVSKGQVTAEAVGNDRNPAQGRAVQRAARAAWVFVPANPAVRAVVARQLGTASGLNPAGVDQASLEGWLGSHQIPYRTSTVGPFEVVVPGRNVTPAQVLGQKGAGS